MKPFITFVLAAKDLKRLVPFLDHLAQTCKNDKSFEVCIAIDEGSEEGLNKIKKNYNFKIKHIPTSSGYHNNMENINKLLAKEGDKDSYFVSCVSDRYRFSCDNWDAYLQEYISIVPDDLFILRLADYSKNIKYRKSLIHAAHCNETWGFITKKTLDVMGGFCSAIGHDAGFEMIHYFIQNNKKDPFRREIPLPNKFSTKNFISSESDGGSITFLQRNIKNQEHIKKVISSFNILESMKSSAVKVYLSHLMWKRKLDGKIIDDKKRKNCFIKLENGKKFKKITYKISYLFYLKQRFSLYYKTPRFENFILSYLPILKTKIGYNFILKLMSSNSRFSKLFFLLLHFIFGGPKTDFFDLLKKKEIRNFITNLKL